MNYLQWMAFELKWIYSILQDTYIFHSSLVQRILYAENWGTECNPSLVKRLCSGCRSNAELLDRRIGEQRASNRLIDIYILYIFIVHGLCYIQSRSCLYFLNRYKTYMGWYRAANRNNQRNNKPIYTKNQKEKKNQTESPQDVCATIVCCAYIQYMICLIIYAWFHILHILFVVLHKNIYAFDYVVSASCVRCNCWDYRLCCALSIMLHTKHTEQHNIYTCEFSKNVSHIKHAYANKYTKYILYSYIVYKRHR